MTRFVIRPGRKPLGGFDVFDTEREFDPAHFIGISAWLNAKRYAKRMNNLTSPIPEPESQPAVFDEPPSPDR